MRPSSNLALTKNKRRSITLISFFLITSLLASVSIFIDSNSIQSWKDNTNTGEVAMMVQGDSLDTIADKIQNVPYVANTGIAETAKAYLRMDKNDVFVGSPDDPLDPMFLMVGQAFSLETGFVSKFPNEFAIVEGRYPQNSSEIAIPEADAQRWSIHIGRMMNYSHGLNEEKRTVFCVGFFVVANNSLRATTTNAIAIVTSEVLNPEIKQTKVYVDVDRSIVSIFDPVGSLERLGIIEKNILELNPEAARYYQIYISDFLETGINSYVDSLTVERYRQISRAQNIILISGMLTFFSTRFNISMREKESGMLVARGVSRRRYVRIILTELIALSISAGLLGLLAGSVLKQIVTLSIFNSNQSSMSIYCSSTLISLDTILFVVLTSILLPIFGYVSNEMVQSGKQRKVEHGRVAKLVKGIKMIRWDVTVIVVIILLTLSPFSNIQLIENNSLLLIIFTMSPIVLFLALASFLSKSLVLLTRIISGVAKRSGIGICSVLGIRSLDRTIRFSLPAILILSLIFGIILNSSAAAESIPVTKRYNSQFLIGGDISFSLDREQSDQWINFTQAVRLQEETAEVSLVSIDKLSLSEGKAGLVEYIAIDPIEYSHVGYTCNGISLDKSNQNGLLTQLQENPEGAILTSDVANGYGLSIGDTLRVFSFGIDSQTVEFNIIGIISTISRPQVLGRPPLESVEGYTRIWLNRNYLTSLVNLNDTDYTFLTVRTQSGVNGTQFGQYVLDDLGFTNIIDEGWSAVSTELDAYLHQQDYLLDRAIDSLQSFQMIFWLAVIVLIYESSRRYLDSTRDTILDTMGATKWQLTKIHFSEIIALILISTIITIIFAPVFVTTTLKLASIQYQDWAYRFPAELFIQIDIMSLLSLGIMALVPSFVLLGVLIYREFASDLTEKLGELSQENAFQGGSF